LRIQTQQKQPTPKKGRPSCLKEIPDQTPPQKKGIQPEATPQTIRRPYKALAFNTLLSSQKTDTHHQEPNRVPSGATLPLYQDPSPCQPALTNRNQPETQPSPTNQPPSSNTHHSKTIRGSPTGRPPSASCIPFWAVPHPPTDRAVLDPCDSGAIFPGAVRLSAFRIPSGRET
jgi:hypothetical protein